MSLTKTPVCNFGEKAKDFTLLSTNNEKITLKDYKGKNGTLVIFICNHCPYVKAIINELVDDIKFLEILGIQYRGRIRALENLKPINGTENDLRQAMRLIAKSQKGPKKQIPSMGCNIKWFK